MVKGYRCFACKEPFVFMREIMMSDVRGKMSEVISISEDHSSAIISFNRLKVSRTSDSKKPDSKRPVALPSLKEA